MMKYELLPSMNTNLLLLKELHPDEKDLLHVCKTAMHKYLEGMCIYETKQKLHLALNISDKS